MNEAEKAEFEKKLNEGRGMTLKVGDQFRISGFIDDADDENLIPKDGKIGFRAIGAHAVVRIGDLKVTALD